MQESYSSKKEWGEVLSPEYNYHLIKLARRKVSLSSIIFDYKIQFHQKEANNGWTHIARCPFPDHQDNTPSFSYNSKDAIFHCFGCNRHGGSVDFLSYLHNKPLLQVAKELLSNYSEDFIQEEIVLDTQSPYYQQLLRFNQKIYQILKQFPEKQVVG